MRRPRARLCAGRESNHARFWARPFVEPSEHLFGAAAAMNMNTEPLCTNIFKDGCRGRENDMLNPMSVTKIDECCNKSYAVMATADIARRQILEREDGVDDHVCSHAVLVRMTRRKKTNWRMPLKHPATCRYSRRGTEIEPAQIIWTASHVSTCQRNCCLLFVPNEARGCQQQPEHAAAVPVLVSTSHFTVRWLFHNRICMPTPFTPDADAPVNH
jgi:hypothetical protein